MKSCNKCGGIEFSKYNRCKTCAKEYASLYRKSNTEKVKAYRAEYIIKNKDRILSRQAEYQKEYRKNNKEKIKYSRIRTKESIVRYMNNRRALLAKVGGKLSKGLEDRLYVLQKGRCACCGVELNGKYNLDHIVPLVLGGKNIDSNIQLLLPKCNREKYTKHPIDFMQSKGYLL